MLIVMVLAITVTFAIGAIAANEGLFLSEGRSAQADSNFAALAGDGELLDPSSMNAPSNLVPFQVNQLGPCFRNEQPVFTCMCPIGPGAQGVMLDLEAPGDYCSFAPGDGDVEDLIINGAPGICLINEIDDCDPANVGPWYDCVAVQVGNPKKVMDGTAARLAKDGGCDGPDAGGWDDFFETISLVFDSGDPLTSIYEARDCDDLTPGKQISPRLVSLVVLKEAPPPTAGTAGHPILAFADFYFAGCASETVTVVDESDLDRYCTLAGTGPPGQAVIYGRFVNLITCADLNGDGKVTGRDVAIVARAQPSQPGHKRWNPDADLNNDNVVDLGDLKWILASLHDPGCSGP